MSNMNYASINESKTSVQSNQKNSLIQILQVTSLISSVLCSIFLILMYNETVSMSNNFKMITTLIQSINNTKISLLTDDLLKLETCALENLQICS